MPGKNTTGKPNTDDYNLGRGIIYFAPLDDNGRPMGYRDLGNSPEFNLSIEVETLEHTSSRRGLRVVDKEVIISQGLSLNFQLDELNHQNLAAVFSGDTATHTNAAVAGFSSYEMIASVEQGRWYDIVDSNGNRAYGISAADLTVEVGGSAAVLDEDYEVDETMGRIFILSGSTTITEGASVDVTLAANANAGDVDRVRGLTRTNVIGALKFIAENPAANDARTEYQFHKVSLKSEGDISLIGDEFTTLGFTAAAEANEDASPDSPTLTISHPSL